MTAQRIAGACCARRQLMEPFDLRRTLRPSPRLTRRRHHNGGDAAGLGPVGHTLSPARPQKASPRRLWGDDGHRKARGADDATGDPAGTGSGNGETNSGSQRALGFCDEDLVAVFLRRDARDDITLFTPLNPCASFNAACSDGRPCPRDDLFGAGAQAAGPLQFPCRRIWFDTEQYEF